MCAVRDGDVIEGDGFTFECVYTPGHTSNHMCFAPARREGAVHRRSRDGLVDNGGDAARRRHGCYMASLRKLLARDDRVLYPTHGGPIRDPKPFLQAYIDHRLEREAQILACLRDGISAIPEMVARMYVDVDKRLHPAAARSVLAHLIQLELDGRVRNDGRQYTLR